MSGKIALYFVKSQGNLFFDLCLNPEIAGNCSSSVDLRVGIDLFGLVRQGLI